MRALAMFLRRLFCEHRWRWDLSTMGCAKATCEHCGAEDWAA